MSADIEKELLARIENLEKMLDICKKNLEEYKKSLDIIIGTFTKK